MRSSLSRGRYAHTNVFTKQEKMAKELSIELQEGENILLTGFANCIGPWGEPGGRLVLTNRVRWVGRVLDVGLIMVNSIYSRNQGRYRSTMVSVLCPFGRRRSWPIRRRLSSSFWGRVLIAFHCRSLPSRRSSWRAATGPSPIPPPSGRAVGMKHQPGRDDATFADIECRPWKEKWPRYIRVHHAEFVAGTIFFRKSSSRTALCSMFRRNHLLTSQRTWSSVRGIRRRRRQSASTTI